MQATARPHLRRTISMLSFTAIAALLAGCATPQPKVAVHKAPRSKEYFAESKYGVAASPRVATSRTDIKRGGGRNQIGKPYKIRGKWYYPKEDRNYSKVGSASWYGDAFHGRLTANGEIYDTGQLTAAHPTMPLPSYARVTNLKTGSSIIVRVNDRGPYHDGRIIDVSKRAAEMLDYSTSGVAKVKVDYVGRAPLEGDDEPYLMASYHPGNREPDPSDGLPTGVMIAMNGPTPSAAIPGRAIPFPGKLVDTVSSQQAIVAVEGSNYSDFMLPDFGPLVPQRPEYDPSMTPPFAVATLSYADERVEHAAVQFATVDRKLMTSDDITSSWKRQNPGANTTAISKAYVVVGSFDDAAKAQRIAGELASFGNTQIEQTDLDGRAIYSVNLFSNGRAMLDEMLEAAWAHGAPDALAVRD